VDRVAAVAGNVVISTSRDGTARVWDLDRHGEVEGEAHAAPVLGVAVSTALKGVCSASQDKTLKVWDMDTGRLLSTLDGFEGPLRAVAFVPGTSRVMTGDGQGELMLLDLDGAKVIGRTAAHVPAIRKTPEGTGFGLGGVVSLRIVREGAHAWSCGSAGDVVDWDLGEDQLTRNEVRLEPPVIGDISADGALAVLGSGDGSVTFANSGDGTAFTLSGASSSPCMAVVADPNGRFAVSSHVDGTLLCWSAGEQSARILAKRDPAGGANRVSWETGKREPLSDSAHVLMARGLAITAGGEFLVAAFSDGWVRVWRLDDLRRYAAFRCDEELYSCAVDGLVIAAGGRHRTHLLRLHSV
jgi:hypothetical protein